MIVFPENEEPPIVPRDGWYYIQPETRFRFEAGTLRDLVSKVESHRIGNGIEIGDARFDVAKFTQDRLSVQE